MAASNIFSQQSADHYPAREFMTIDELSAYIGLSKRAIYQSSTPYDSVTEDWRSTPLREKRD